MKVQLGNEIVDGEEIEFEPITEPWNEYACADGANVRIRSIVTKITRIVGRYNPNGEPLYLIASNPVVAVTPPPGTEPGR